MESDSQNAKTMPQVPQAQASKIPRNRHAGKTPLLSAIILSVVGTLFLLSWPLTHFLLWPACAAVIASLMMVIAVMLPFILVMFNANPEDVFGSIFDQVLQSFSEYDPVLFVLMGVGVVMLIVAAVQFYKYYKANGTLKAPAKTVASASTDGSGATPDSLVRPTSEVAAIKSEPSVQHTSKAAIATAEPLAQRAPQTVSATPEETVDLGNPGYYFLGLLLPMVGVVLWLYWHKSNPISSRQCEVGALMFLLMPFVFAALHFASDSDVEGTIIALVLLAIVAIPVVRGFLKIKQMKAEIIAKYTEPTK